MPDRLNERNMTLRRVASPLVRGADARGGRWGSGSGSAACAVRGPAPWPRGVTGRSRPTLPRPDEAQGYGPRWQAWIPETSGPRTSKGARRGRACCPTATPATDRRLWRPQARALKASARPGVVRRAAPWPRSRPGRLGAQSRAPITAPGFASARRPRHAHDQGVLTRSTARRSPPGGLRGAEPLCAHASGLFGAQGRATVTARVSAWHGAFFI